jgi:hypothetical protein
MHALIDTHDQNLTLNSTCDDSPLDHVMLYLRRAAAAAAAAVLVPFMPVYTNANIPAGRMSFQGLTESYYVAAGDQFSLTLSGQMVDVSLRSIVSPGSPPNLASFKYGSGVSCAPLPSVHHFHLCTAISRAWSDACIASPAASCGAST